MENRSFRELLRASFKSSDTEEWLDVHFTRPIGLAFALLWEKLGVHPNAITVLSIFLGLAAGYMFYFTDLCHNICGIVLLMLANFCDSTDGQLARLTGKKTLVGRVLDGLSGDIWFTAIYLAFILRLWNQNIPLTDHRWGFWALVLAFVAGVMSHSPQSSLADYYRQIHLYFIKGRQGSELDKSDAQDAKADQLPEHDLFGHLFYTNYARYCRSQEKRTPRFQRFYNKLHEKYGDNIPQEVRQEFREGSLPLMPLTNILTFNTRAIMIYITALLNCPWVYMVIEITVMNLLYWYMKSRHERLCERMTSKL